MSIFSQIPRYKYIRHIDFSKGMRQFQLIKVKFAHYDMKQIHGNYR